MFSFESSYIHLKTTSILICLVFFTGNLGAYAADPSFLFNICPNKTTYSRSSTYFFNLRTLLTSLSSRNAAAYVRFQNATAGSRKDTAYGVFLCRGDVSPEVCQNCVIYSAIDSLQRCPTQKEAIFWYDECMLMYSNKNIFSVMSTSPLLYMWNTQNVSSIKFERFNELISSMLSTAAVEASVSTGRVAAKQLNFTAIQTMYGMVQCTTDISRQDCVSCIRRAINQLAVCCNGRIGGRVITPSCFIRYEIYPFFNETALAALATPPPRQLAPPTAPPGSAVPPQERRGGKSRVLVIAIPVSIAASIVLFTLGYCFLVIRARRKYNAAPRDDAGNDDITTAESLQIEFSRIEDATNKFSEENKLGEGGFGVV